MNFKQALTTHIHAIETRDLKAYQKTIAKDVLLILPNGHMISGYDEMINFHKDWFSDPDWSMKLEILSLKEYSDTAMVLYDVIYMDLDQDCKPYELKYFLSLHFKLEAGKWLLTFDQNTLKK